MFDKSVRQVAVDGEAYFDVAKDKKRPFIVETGKCNMEVLGTKFNVEGYSDKDDFEVTFDGRKCASCLPYRSGGIH